MKPWYGTNIWTAEEYITSRPTSLIFNPKAVKTELHTDASERGMILQSDSQGNMKLVYAISKKHSDVGAIYHLNRLELMTIAWAMERLRAFLISIIFTVITNCDCLIHLNA